MKKAWVLTLLLCVFSVPLTAQEQDQKVWNSGNEFLSLCGDMPDSPPAGAVTFPPKFHWGMCLGYVRGVDDGVQMAYDIQNDPQPYCVPSEVTTGQMIRVLTKFIKDHPEKAHSKTKVLEIESLKDAFPCKQPSKKQ